MATSNNVTNSTKWRYRLLAIGSVAILLFLIYFFPNAPEPAADLDGAYSESKSLISSPLDFSSSSILLVSAFFPLPTSKHTDSEYASWLTLFLGQVTTPMVVYTTSSFAPTIKAVRGSLPIIIDTRFQTPFEIPPLRGLEDIYQMQHTTLDPESRRHSPSLYATWNAKAWFLEDAATRHSGNHSRWFFWSDAGALREKHVFADWPDPYRTEELFSRASRSMNTSPPPLIFIPIFDAPESSTKTDGWTMANGPLNLYMMSEGGLYQILPKVPLTHYCIGSFFGGNLASIGWWSSTFYRLHDYYLSRNMFVGKDQNLFNSMMFLYPDQIFTVWPRDPLRREDQSATHFETQKHSLRSECTWDKWYYYVYWLASPKERRNMRSLMAQQYNAQTWLTKVMVRLGLPKNNYGRGECALAREWGFRELLEDTINEKR